MIVDTRVLIAVIVTDRARSLLSNAKVPNIMSETSEIIDRASERTRLTH